MSNFKEAEAILDECMELKVCRGRGSKDYGGIWVNYMYGTPSDIHMYTEERPS